MRYMRKEQVMNDLFAGEGESAWVPPWTACRAGTGMPGTSQYDTLLQCAR